MCRKNIYPNHLSCLLKKKPLFILFSNLLWKKENNRKKINAEYNFSLQWTNFHFWCPIGAPQDILLWFHLFSTKSGPVTYERLLYKPIEALIFWWQYSKFNFIQNLWNYAVDIATYFVKTEIAQFVCRRLCGVLCLKCYIYLENRT